MNRIETKIIIMVTSRLAAANDSDAKTEMIEELSENLYQRYLELTADGMPEEEALKRAMDSLGDAGELLDFLRETEQDGGKTKNADRADSAGAGKTFSFSMDDLGKEIEEAISAALTTAKGAMNSAKDVAKDVTSQLKEKYPDGMFTQFSRQRSQKAECVSIPAENVNSLEIDLTYGDIRICCADDPEAFIEVSGDTKDVETMLKENGILSISQQNTASASFLHMRGIRYSDIEVRLPKKVWDKATISASKGDINIDDALECRELNISASSGDIVVNDISGNLHVESKSGNIEAGGNLDKCELFSTSGDVLFCGKSKELSCSSTCGDIALDLNSIPKKATVNYVSGDCEAKVPTNGNFRLAYRTVSGEFLTNLPFSGTLGEKSGEVAFGNGEEGEILISSVSGNINICAGNPNAEEAPQPEKAE